MQTLAKDPNPCRVIGVLDDGAESLTPTALAHIRNADVIISWADSLALFAPLFKPDAQVHDATGKLSEVPEWVRSARALDLRCVVLATGDPLCFGVGSYLASRLCVNAVDVMPNVSTIQLACARLGLSWADMKLASIHTRDTGEWERGAPPSHGMYALAQQLRRHMHLAVLTSPENTPGRIARLLQIEGLAGDFRMAVAECLASPQERVLGDLSVDEVASGEFAHPNVVLLWRQTPLPDPVLTSQADSAFAQRQPDKGLITKQEVRAVSLARLQLRAASVVWDIGAGSGSVGLEAARLCQQGHVFAIEKNAGDFAIAQSNHAAFGLSNYSLFNAKAPELLDGWPDPDAVFVGGSGGELAELIRLITQRLKPGGHLVMNFVTLENLATATATLQALEDSGIEWDVLQLQAARSKPILHMHRMAAENPVWIVTAKKEN